jgi:hypothetical protein
MVEPALAGGDDRETMHAGILHPEKDRVSPELWKRSVPDPTKLTSSMNGAGRIVTLRQA